MNILDFLKFQLEPGVGKLFYVPDSGKLAGMCWSKQEMYHERFRNDTHVFFGFGRGEKGEMVYAKVYARKVDNSIRVRDIPLWIKFTQMCRLPEEILEETALQFDDPDYLIRRLRVEINNMELQKYIDSLGEAN